jgi:ABC-type lipoprotein export system ATPase subunit
VKSEFDKFKLFVVWKMLLELVNVAKRYALPGGTDAPYVLKDVTLQVASGESVAIVGPSGSGKSTLLNIIGALDRPTAGRVLLEGRDLSELSDNELAVVRNRQVGFVFQLHHLLPQYTALENVLVPTLAGPSRSFGDEAEERARHLLERVDLGDRLLYRPGRLSGGERQRVAVVRALINRPKLLLADEPTGSLDRAAAENLARLLAELNSEEGVTLILATHSLDLAARMARVLELRDGKLVSR